MVSMSFVTFSPAAHAQTAAVSGGSASAAPGAPPMIAKPAQQIAPNVVARPVRSGGRVNGAALPAAGTRPPQVTAATGARVSGTKGANPPPVHPALGAHGSVHGPAAAVAPNGRAASWNGTAVVANPAMTPPAHHLVPLAIPAGPRSAAPAYPSGFASPKQVDSYAGCSGFGANEPGTAQSTDNPNLVVVAFQSYQQGSGCGDSHAFASASSDAGLHWSQTELPGLQDAASGDTQVAYDAVHHVFVLSFIEFTRDSVGNPIAPGRLGVEVSSDGVNWALDATLATTTSSDFIDKDGIAADMNPSSPHYGRVAVSWTDFGGSGQFFYDAYTDNGGSSWNFGSTSINYGSNNCGNGTSPAFDANGDLMVAWFGCNGGGTQELEELSTDGGATWPAPADTTISGISNIGSAGSDGGCIADNGGTAFRCNSFPSLGGDPNSADEGGQAFIVNWADAESTTQNSITATISQIRSLTSTDGGASWGHAAFMNFDNFGDKFFPAVSFAPDGRLNLTYSNREDSASNSNPNGSTYDQWNTEATNLATFLGNSYITYVADGTLQNPGTRGFIGDYSGETSDDNNFDTIPTYTAANGSNNNVLIQDLCYVDCYSPLSPGSPVSGGTTSAFDDRYQFNTNGTVGSGNDFWNAVGIREGADGSTVDDDMYMYGDRYFGTLDASSDFSPPYNDYVVENDNAGHGTSGPYYVDVHGFTPGPYTLEWAAGSIIVSSSGIGYGASMAAADVVRVYDTFLSTGTTYHLGLRPTAGNTSNYSFTLHSGSNANQQGRPQAVADSGNVAPGQPAFLTYATGTSTSQYDGVVVLNNNGGAGSYSVYVDSAVPSGTITINGGATYTHSQSVTLGLSASNPNSSDPVADMRFSPDGSTWGAWVPYASTYGYALSATNGSQTVYVQYRNAAGGVSAAASHSIILDTTAPTTTASLSGTATGCSTYFAPVTVSLSASDDRSGIASTVYQVDGGSVTTYTGPFSVTAAGGHSVTFHSTDGAGNVEATQTASFTIAHTMILDSPTSGAVGKTASVTGSGFKSGEVVNVYWDSTTTTAVATTTASSGCAISTSFAVPAAVNGVHTIIAKGATSGASATVSFTVIAALTLQPTAAAVGKTVTVTGGGFAASQPVSLHWKTASGTLLASATTGTTGSFTVTIKVPKGTAGTYSVYGVEATPALTAVASLTIVPAIKVSPASGLPGAAITVSGTGFAASQTVTIKWNCATATCSSTTVLGTVTTTSTGTFSKLVHAPTGAATGTYPIGSADTSSHFATINFKVT